MKFLHSKYWIVLGSLIATVHFFIMLVTHYERGVFICENPWNSITGKVSYILFFIVLVLFWIGFVFLIYKTLVEKNKSIRIGVIFGGSYFVLSFLLLLLVWPGTWSADDYGVLVKAINMTIDPWQHIISSFVQIISLLLIPTMSGVIIVQLVIISSIVGYFIMSMNMMYSIQNKWKLVVLMCPFILPPILLYNYSAFRAVLCSWFVFLLSFKLFRMWKTDEKIGNLDLLIIIFLTIVVGAWRTENIYYGITIPIILFFDKRTNLNKRKWIFVSALILGGVLTLTKLNNLLLNNNNYSLVSTFVQMGDFVKVIDPVDDEQDIRSINRVIKMDILKEHPDEDGVTTHWHYNIIREGYSQNDYNQYMRSFLHLVFKYPTTFLSNRVRYFVNAMGITKAAGTLTGSACSLYENHDIDKEIGIGKENQPINDSIRKRTILFLGCENVNGAKNSIYIVFWNIAIPILIMVVSLAVLMRKKKFYPFWILFNFLLSCFIIFLTEPWYYFMYYLSHYLIGYVVLSLWIFYFVYQRDKLQQA